MPGFDYPSGFTLDLALSIFRISQSILIIDKTSILTQKKEQNDPFLKIMGKTGCKDGENDVFRTILECTIK